jgi:hypothetical protein
VIIMKKLLVVSLLSMLSFGCATNPILNGKNVGGVIGASGGAYGGSVLTKNSSKEVQIASIAGGALLGWLAGSYVGEEFFDKKDRERRVALIEDTLEKNRDNEVSTTQYTKSWRTPDGNNQSGVVSQSAVPLRTYPPQGNMYAQNNMSGGLPNGHPDKWKQLTFTQPHQLNQVGVCRDLEITFSVAIDNAPPSTQQYYKMCKTEQGWRAVQ